MRGYCNCDLCGRSYKRNDNEQYDGITMWWFDRNKDIRTPEKDDILGFMGDRNLSKERLNIPAVLDVCPDCMERFANWIILMRNENKLRIYDDDFPMNKPE